MIRSFAGTSLVDYPGHVSAVVFLGGCNLYCPFCHNPELVRPDLLAEQYSMSDDHVIFCLKSREGFIEGVCVTGGEPLLQPQLPEFLRRIRDETGLLLKLDTNGTFPGRLEAVLPLLDYVSLDIKASPSAYERATGGVDCTDDVLESVRILRDFPDYELRTTMVPGIVDMDGLAEVLELVGEGCRRYVLQPFRPGKTLSPEFASIAPYSGSYMERARQLVSSMGPRETILRSAI